VTTNENGYYGWMVPEGTYRVRAYKDGYMAYDSLNDPNFSSFGSSLLVVPPAREHVDFTMAPSVSVTSVSVNKTTLSLAVGSALYDPERPDSLESILQTAGRRLGHPESSDA
jgi:hypothetical protein